MSLKISRLYMLHVLFLLNNLLLSLKSLVLNILIWLDDNVWYIVCNAHCVCCTLSSLLSTRH